MKRIFTKRATLRSLSTWLCMGVGTLTMHPATAQLPPPGIIQSVDINDLGSTSFPLPFLPNATDPQTEFLGQIETSGLIIYQWDAPTQLWKTATYTPGTGWTGDVIVLAEAQPILLKSVTSGTWRISLTGIFPADSLEQTMYPGLNLVAAPVPMLSPLTSWNWDALGISDTVEANADTLYDIDNIGQAWLELDGSLNIWTGKVDPQIPGTLNPGLVYWYDSQNTQSFLAEEIPVLSYDDQTRPAVTGVTYDTTNQKVVLIVETSGGTENLVNIYYQDVTFPEGFKENEDWQLLVEKLNLGAGTTFQVDDAGAQERPHPQTPSMRVYQVGNALQDSDGDLFSDTFEQLILGTNPQTFNPTPQNVPYLTRQVWWDVFGENVAQLTQIETYPWEPDVSEEVTGLFEAPYTVANDYGQRMMGRFTVPLTGDYTFWVAADHSAELWIEVNEVRQLIASQDKNVTSRQWNGLPSQKSDSILLTAGDVVVFEAIMKERAGYDHLAVGAQFPDNRYERPMRARRFLEYTGDPIAFTTDTDSDGLSDYEEWVLGTNPALTDTSGDGTSDYDAVALALDPLLQHPTPLISATWVLQYDFDPYTIFQWQDPDTDGLTNYDEFLLGTNPLNEDTSGDGVTDYEAAYIFNVDPTLTLFTGQTTQEIVATAGTAEILSGEWELGTGESLIALTRNGSLKHTLTLQTPGVYAVRYSIREANPLIATNIFDLSLSIDGTTAGRQSALSSRKVVFLTKSLTAGAHTFTLAWHNAAHNTRLEVLSVELVKMEGVDNDQSGTADWLEARAENAIDADLPLTSSVSPVCVEGESLYKQSLSLSSSASTDPQEVFAAQAGVENGWYANIPLSETGSTTLVLNEDYSGATQTNQVVWVETNLLPQATEPILLREGDALKFTAVPAGQTEGTITIDIGNDSYQTTAGTPIAHLFDTAGNHTVSATWSHNGDTQQSQTTVQVIGGGFTSPPSIVSNRDLMWENANLPDEAWLDHSNFLEVSEQNLYHGRRITVQTINTQPRVLLARLGEEGPVLDAITIDSIAIQTNNHTRVIESYPDGSRLIELMISLDDVPDNIRLDMSTLTGGALFENGTHNASFTKDDFDGQGVLVYRMIQQGNVSGNTCHAINVFDDTTGVKIAIL